MASAKQLKKLRETIQRIQSEQAKKPAPLPKAVAVVKVGGKVIGEMKPMKIKNVTNVVAGRTYQPPTGAPGFKSMGRGRRKNRISLYNKIR